MTAPPARDPSAPRAWDGIGQALVLVALSLLAWLPSAVGGGFSFDDREAIEGNPVVEGGLPWTAAFQQDYWEHRGAAGHFRPLASLSLRFDRAAWGEQGAGFHATNVILHALVVFAAAMLARRWFGRERSWPWVGLALFAVHPVLADSVAWISGRSSMLAALPGLCAALFIARSDASESAPRGKWFGLFALGFVGTGLASLGKEDGLLWIFALPCLAARRGRSAVVATAMGCVCGALAMFALRGEALGSIGINAPNAPLAAAAIEDRLLVGGRVFLEALRLAVWPASYAPSYSGDPVFSVAAMRAAPWLGILGLVAWVAMLGVAIVSARRSRGIASVSACLALIAWIPFLGIVPAGEIFAPRFLYLPLLFAIPLVHAGAVLAFGRRATLVAGLAVLLALAAAWSRGRVYSSRGAFRHAVLTQRPDDVPSWNDLGLFHEENGDLARARESWLHATTLDPHYSRAWSNLGRVELGLGHPEAALALLERAVQEGPKNAIAHLNLGSARMAVRDWVRAEENYRAAIRLAPGLAPAREGLARSLKAQGREEGVR
ncbi:MAG TPA: tetratricopeptide repeat protein [Planctomycetota bacterium]|nr:tetratricopeptide repeat protein [Planctomycetota bacterium]